MGRRTLVALGRSQVLLGYALVELPVAVVSLLGLILSCGLGLVFFFPPTMRLLRAVAGANRRTAGAWSGAVIAAPYLPEPPPIRPQPDGWYRWERTLYKSPRFPTWNQRLAWLFRDPATYRELLWIAVDPVVKIVLGALPLLVLGYGLALPWLWTPWAAPLSVLSVVAAALCAPWLVTAHAYWTRLLLAPTRRALLAQQVSRLSQARTEAVDFQAAELRRIERDLHDGAQARLVAMGMTLGAAEQLVDTDPAAAKALLAKARETSATALTELRELVRGIHPPVLAERGLGDAVRALALDSPLRVRVTVDLPARPAAPVESAAYFAISELLANAARHADAEEVAVDISHQGPALRITVSDDGRGGADPARGSGLRGLERRLAAFDGVLAVHSPPGGPTQVSVELPHALQGKARAKPAGLSWQQTLLLGVLWGTFWLPLFPQGLVALILKLAGVAEKSWFFALYLPGALSWIVIGGFIILGAAMLTTALVLSARRSQADGGLNSC